MKKNSSCADNLNFLGAGCYQHYVPAICDEINGKGEFLTAYGGEAYNDFGRFQTLFEFQSMLLLALTGCPYAVIEEAIIYGGKLLIPVLVILYCIGALMGSWIASGTVPMSADQTVTAWVTICLYRIVPSPVRRCSYCCTMR